MTKTQLIAALAEQMGGDKKAASSMFDALTGIITETVSQGGAVTMPGVGKISLRERPERMARNCSNGEQIMRLVGIVALGWRPPQSSTLLLIWSSRPVSIAA